MTYKIVKYNKIIKFAFFATIRRCFELVLSRHDEQRKSVIECKKPSCNTATKTHNMLLFVENI